MNHDIRILTDLMHIPIHDQPQHKQLTVNRNIQIVNNVSVPHFSMKADMAAVHPITPVVLHGFVRFWGVVNLHDFPLFLKHNTKEKHEASPICRANAGIGTVHNAGCRVVIEPVSHTLLIGINIQLSKNNKAPYQR